MLEEGGHIGKSLGYIALSAAIIKQDKRLDDDREWLQYLKDQVRYLMGERLLVKNSGSYHLTVRQEV